MGDGILTAAGIAAWVQGNKYLVKEWDVALIDTAEATTFTMFEGASQSENILVGATALTAYKRTVINSSMVKKGEFYEKNFVATHLALEVEPSGAYDATAANDLQAITILGLEEFAGRTWFTMYFDDVVHDRGGYKDFPAGRGITKDGATSTSADTVVVHAVTNGLPSRDAMNPLAKPKRCSPDTKPKLEVSFPLSACGFAGGDIALRATIHGVAGL